MPNIEMCQDHKCPSRRKCWRYSAPPKAEGQQYTDFGRIGKHTRCQAFWGMSRAQLAAEETKGAPSQG